MKNGNSRKSPVRLSAQAWVSLFSPSWPWTPASASWDPWAAPWCIPPTLTSNSKFPQSLICPSDLVKTCSALFLRSKGSYLGHLWVFPSPWYQHLLWLRMPFGFLLALRSEVGDGRGGAALEDASGPDCDSWVLPCWAWECERALSPVELRRLGLHHITVLSYCWWSQPEAVAFKNGSSLANF